MAFVLMDTKKKGFARFFFFFSFGAILVVVNHARRPRPARKKEYGSGSPTSSLD
jgi:hypothetical protein